MHLQSLIDNIVVKIVAVPCTVFDEIDKQRKPFWLVIEGEDDAKFARHTRHVDGIGDGNWIFSCREVRTLGFVP